MTLTEQYEQLCHTPSDIVAHLPRLHALVLELNAQHVIELGTRTGVSTVAFLVGLEQTGGRLTSIDIDAPPPFGHPQWEFIQGDDLDPRIVADLQPADIVFIDTSHFWRHTLAELFTYQWLVKPGGRIVCHDTELARPMGAPLGDPSYPVKTAINEFTRAQSLEWTNHPECWGLGIITVT